ncbi:aminotransferase family protein [Ostreibacterium oceani]|uniref:Aminotransferase class III-fold pyridoxal phosphate-dependent enzyme n=1 Tax=Ostreibacterium oceani TaxID=2654998 RepID=A0A6N7ESU5_9GAMM|nr:aminotransferase class III-fold pyridoxal phosphate-dependent enzyme [Ostreibacterium oceani]MPV85572.1 aminotransferase class III-fold pyridoxal phosphate-dependent enzyme [Ostreibacterium oceani]
MSTDKTNPPGANDSQTLRQFDQQHVWHHLTQHKALEQNPALMIRSGNGMMVTDTDGNQYLDATSGGVWTVNLGYGRQQIVDAIAKQLSDLPYFAGALGNEPAAKFAKVLADLLPNLSRIYYASSGSEANEKAYKIVRQLSQSSSRQGKRKIVYRDRDYHGTTIAALSSSGHNERKAQYGPFLDDFVEIPHCCCYRCPFNKTYPSCNIECAQAFESEILKQGPDTVGSVVLESITAGGGVIVPVPEYLPMIADICKQYGVLLHIDEVVTGMGRTGTWFGFEHFNVFPDMITLAKGLAGGYAAISVLATTETIFEAFKTDTNDPLNYFRDISTFGGCTAGPAAALANIDIIQTENLLNNAKIMGDYFIQQLRGLAEKHPCIGDIRGKGLFIGIELVDDRKTKHPVDEARMTRVFLHCLQHGVMIGRSNRSVAGLNNVLLLSPALICDKAKADDIITAIDAALTATFKQTVFKQTV